MTSDDTSETQLSAINAGVAYADDTQHQPMTPTEGMTKDQYLRQSPADGSHKRARTPHPIDAALPARTHHDRDLPGPRSRAAPVPLISTVGRKEKSASRQ